MSKKATAADAELILKLYDLRREPEMRKARNWMLVEFWPKSADEFVKVANALGTQENAWLRQVGGYWDMAAAMVLHGAINADLFLEGGVSGEMIFMYAKFKPMLKDLRQKMNSPTLLSNVERVIMENKFGRERLKIVSARVEGRLKAFAEAGR
jgi:hypothetical protein